MALRTVRVPEGIESLFAEAEAVVSRYFRVRKDDPEHGTIEVFGERYVLVRAASLSVEFFRVCEELFGAGREAEAAEFARNILFDLAHAVGRSDAQNFHAKMGLEDPIARLSAGPVHFAHTGWAFVEISPESKPTPNEEFFLLYDHPYSFEADAWVRAGKRHDLPVCIMNAGYSAGWCEESFGVNLVAAELLCRGKGDPTCRFVMAHPRKIEQHVAARVHAVPGRPTIPDLFARKRMEDELRRAHDELERRVQERTAELSQSNERLRREIEQRERIERQLVQVQKLEALGRLAGGIAHDFNNLVAVTHGASALLRERLEDHPSHTPLIDDIVSACDRAANLTKQLLAFGRTHTLTHEKLDLRQVVAEEARMLERLIGEDVELALSLGEREAWVLADRTHLDQMIVNLAVNARDAMPNGGRLLLSVDVVRVDERRAAELQLSPGPYVRLIVSDEGTGIDEQTLPHIFDPFFTTKESGRGTGLGLSTVYGVVRQSGGAIAVHSKPSEGTTFEIFLPQVEAKERTSASELRAQREGGGETILLVEDQIDLRKILAAILDDLGYVVVVADDSQHALALAERTAVDLLLTDVVMPRIGGPELADRIAALRGSLRVLYMSGYAEERIVAQGVNVKGVPWLEKPFGPDELAKKVREALARPPITPPRS